MRPGNHDSFVVSDSEESFLWTEISAAVVTVITRVTVRLVRHFISGSSSKSYDQLFAM
jgi:hypothetical protein